MRVLLDLDLCLIWLISHHVARIPVECTIPISAISLDTHTAARVDNTTGAHEVQMTEMKQVGMTAQAPCHSACSPDL